MTESIFLGDSANALDVLKRLRALGVGIALDDFGTGYSSLGYLNKAVFHKLKIDGSFVREAGTQQGDGGDHPVDRPARQELPDDGDRRRASRPPTISPACAISAATRSRAICSAGR